MEMIMKRNIRNAAWLLCLVLFSSCYEDYILDFDNNAVYFTYQTDVRTFVVGEKMEIQVGAVLAGVRQNTRDRVVDFTIEPGLLTEDMLATMQGGMDYVKEGVAGVQALELLPSDYYTLSDNAKMVIKAGDHKGVITVKVNPDKFLADPKTKSATYALPFKILKADADSVLAGKEYSVIGVRYENMLFGNYWHGGVTVVKDAAGNPVSTKRYFTEIPSPETRVMKLKTVAPYTLVANRISDQAGEFNLTLDGDKILISPVEGAAIQVLADGESRFNGAKLLQDRQIYLSYKYANGDGTTSYATDTLTFRNRIRDGINEWQDENTENYD